MAHLVCVCVCVCVCVREREYMSMFHCSRKVLPEFHSVSPLSLISLQWSVQKQREGTHTRLRK